MLDDAEKYKPFPILYSALQEFPYRPKADGSCEMLHGRQCSVYEDRPLLCNVKRLGELHDADMLDWYRVNAISCNILIKEDGLSDDYLVEL